MRAMGSAEASVYQSVRRSCYAGLDSVTLRLEVARRIGRLIPFDAHNLATTDPDTGLFTHAVAAGIPASLNEAWLGHLYPFRVAAEIIDMARAGEVATASVDSEVMEILRPAGFAHDLRSVLAEAGSVWGFTCLLRALGSPPFSAREIAFMRSVAPHLAAGLRTAALQHRAGSNGTGRASRPVTDTDSGIGDDTTTLPAQHSGFGTTTTRRRDRTASAVAAAATSGPGVLVLDGRRRVRTRNAFAAQYVDDLRDVGRGPDEVPYAVSSAVARLAHAHQAGASDASVPLCGELRVQGRSGCWYTIHASLAEPRGSGCSDTIVLIEIAQPAVVAPMLARLYGLTPRERELTAMAARGWSTRRMASELGISPHTVQEHLGNACEKVGVRTRIALLAKIFFDGYAPVLTGG
jgi:DNA-binding CsgD family transcriptional regulator